ncbi:MAG: hypothetical protein CMJ86_10450 [Planctomycetes bacterium]|nr:hypothetical protein [Planctomycetota bacterium]
MDRKTPKPANLRTARARSALARAAFALTAHPPLEVNRSVSLATRSFVAGWVLAGLASGSIPARTNLTTQGQTASRSSGACVERQLGVMGTGLEIVVWAPQRSTGLTASEAGVRALEETEKRLSTWQKGSEFSSLNRATLGSWQDLSPTTAEDLKRALDLARATNGLFDPTLGHLVQAWDLRGEGRLPSAVELETARSKCGYQGIEFDGTRFRRTQDVLLEEGAFGKGAGLDRAASALMAAGAQAASFNLGGQWLFVGPGDWSVQLAHPAHRTEAVLGLRLPPGSMATSANSERMLKLRDGEVGHLLDPRTGIPSGKTHSVSVWAKSALVADALSTAIFIDPSRAAEFAQRFDAEVILLRTTGTGLTASITPGLVKVSDPLTPNLQIIPLVYQQSH